MPRRPVLNPEQHQQVVRLRQDGLSLAAIAKAIQNDFLVKASKSMIQRVLERMAKQST